MKPLVDYLGKKEYLFGEELTFLDFYMLELCDFVEWLTEGQHDCDSRERPGTEARQRNGGRPRTGAGPRTAPKFE